jgi:organic hydroperoxide reductase OsmC/OhrA
MKLAGRKVKVRVPEDATIDAEVGLWFDGERYFLKARLNISLLGVDREIAEALTHASDGTRPYWNATRGNIDVVITLV